MEKIYLEILELIKQYDTITIFRHAHPDCDAVGAQFALKSWILDNFNTKQVYACGYEDCGQGIFPSHEEVSDEIIQNSLAIVLDCSNKERVDDLRFESAKHVIKIDHHPDLTPFGDTQLVIVKAAATCEILTYFFQYFKDYKLSITTANYLYKGILTDTICFKTSNTSAKTLESASYLAQFGIDIPSINRELFDISLDEFEFASYIRSKLICKGKSLGYIILSDDELKKYQMKPHDARNYISEIGNIKEFEIWCMFTEKEDQSGFYDGSLRSKTIPINDLARSYKGGGHANASGVKDLTYDELMELMDKLQELIK